MTLIPSQLRALIDREWLRPFFDWFESWGAGLAPASVIGAPVADITALKAIGAADRSSRQIRIVEADAQFRRTAYVFDANSSAPADNNEVLQPTTGSGRWFRLSVAATGQIAVWNGTGGVLAKGTAVAIAGWDVTHGRMNVQAADPTNPILQAIGVVGSDIADAAAGSIGVDFQLVGSGFNTGGASVGDPVFLAAGGGLSLSPPAAGLTQIVAFVETVGANATLRVGVQRPAPVAPAAVVAHRFQAGPASGGAALPTFRAMAAGDVPIGCFRPFRGVAGRNGAGALTCTGAKVGDRVLLASITGASPTTSATSSLETTVTVDNQVQQSDAADLSAGHFDIVLLALS